MAIKAKITVDNSELKKGLKDTENQAKKSMDIIKDVAGSASKGFGNLSSILTKMGGKIAIIATAILAVYKGVKAWFSYVDRTLHKMNDIGKAAKSLNMTAEGYQEVSFAARRSGIGMEKTENIILKLSFALAKAAEGTKETVNAFSELGVSWSELEKMSPQAQLNSMVYALKQIKDVSKRTKILTNLGFNKRDIQTFNKMVNNDFGKMMASASIFGVVFSEEQIQMAERYIDEIETATERMQAVTSKLKTFKETKELMEDFKASLPQKLADTLDQNSFKVSNEYKDFYVGIGDATDDFLKRLKKQNKYLYEELMRMQKVWKFINLEGYFNRNYLYPLVAEKDPRFANFDSNDKSTWIQARTDVNASQFDEEKRKADQIEAAIKRLNQELDAKAKKHKDHIISLEKELTLETLIKKVREEAGLKDEDILDPAYIEQIRNLYNELKKLEHIDIKITINAQTEKLRLMHEIEMAILNGDKERARVLRTILKLQEAGIDATEDEVNNNETNLETAQGNIDKYTHSMKVFEKDHGLYELYQKRYDEAKEKARVAAEALLKATEEYDQIYETSEGGWSVKRLDENGHLYDKEAKLKEKKAEIDELNREAVRALEAAAAAERGMAKHETEEEDYQEAQRKLKEAEAALQRAQAIQAANAQVSEEDRQEAERKQKTLEQHTKELERQNEITQAEIAGDYERANTLKLLNELKQMGIDIDEEELKKNEEKYQALKRELAERRRLNLARNVTDKENSLLIQAMKRVGLTKEAAYYEAILNAEKVKGAKLDYWEEQHIRNLVDIEMELNDPSNKLDLSGMDTKTNELTARGGFASGALTTPLETINSQIRDYAKRQTELLDKINQEIENGSLI